MKRILKLFIAIFLSCVCLFSCSNDETKVILTGTGSAPALTVSSTADLVLTKSIENYSSLQFQWTNPNYEFSNGVSTQDVNYTLQVDTTGSNFTNPKMVKLSYIKDVSHSFTVKELNTALAGLELPDNVAHNFEFRVQATLVGNAPQYSNVLKIKITTYLDVVYPVPDQLFIIGSALPSGWVNKATALVNQKMTKEKPYLFTLANATFSAGEFHFLSRKNNKDDDWNDEYGFTGEANKNNVSGDSFAINNKNFAPPAPGNYRVIVNFKTGKYSVEKL